MPHATSRAARLRLIAVGAIVLGAGLAACGGGTVVAPPVPASSSPGPASTPVSLPATASFTKSAQVSLTVTPPPAGQTPKPVPVSLPTAGGFGGTFSLPIGSQNAIAPGTQVLSTLTNQAPGGIPTLSFLRRVNAAHVHADDSSSVSVILYLSMAFSGGVTLANQPAISFTLPSGYVVSGASYYVSLYDPTRPSLGWQNGFEGPGTVSGTSVSFTGGSGTFNFTPFMQYWFALYAQSQALPAPTPAPTQTPQPPPTPTPAPVVITGISLTAAGQIQVVTPSGSGPFVGFSSNPNVVTVTAGASSVTVTAVSAGTAQVTIGGPSGQTVVPVTVTTTTIPVQ